jgi:hypothetical protein
MRTPGLWEMKKKYFDLIPPISFLWRERPHLLEGGSLGPILQKEYCPRCPKGPMPARLKTHRPAETKPQMD